MLKVEWMLSLISTFSYIHSCKVFVDDIALRNVLIIDDQLKLADFGQSVLLPLDSDIASVNENDLNVRIEILHLGWILYSIASWQVHKCYFFFRRTLIFVGLLYSQILMTFSSARLLKSVGWVNTRAWIM